MGDATGRDSGAGGRLRFLLDGELIELDGVDPTRTVLELLREDLGRLGTKEGCAEGDCGACTVVLGELDASGEGMRHRAVNACIQFAPTLDGKQLVTVESLTGVDGSLHPVQQALVDHHGSQCGFCTPGFVMSLFALCRTDPRPSRRAIDDALSGNLCRCTGYRPIVAAAQAVADLTPRGAAGARDAAADGPAAGDGGCPRRMGSDAAACAALVALRRTETFALRSAEGRYFAPVSLDALADLVEAEPDACLLAGGTDVGLWVTKHLRALPTLVYTGNVSELCEVALDVREIRIGAAVSLTRAAAALVAEYPELEELFVRFASPPIRNAGTLGGNIANGSPIGDSMPALMVLDARLGLRKGAASREIPLDAFYLGYQRNALAPGELLASIHVPRARPGLRLRSYKVSKRFDQDISAVCGAFALACSDGRVTHVRIAYGGLAATVARARRCEEALLDAPWGEAAVERAMAALDQDFTPIDDMRATAAYRSQVAKNLLYRFFLETSGDGPDDGPSDGRDRSQAASGIYGYGR